MSEIKNKMEDENKDEGEIKMCSLCRKSIDPDSQIKLPCNKHFIHKEDCAIQWLLKKKSCSPCAHAKRKRKKRFMKEKIRVSEKWYYDENDLVRISPELAEFFENYYNEEMASYNKQMDNSSPFWELLFWEPEKPAERMSRKDVYNKIIYYCLDHNLYDHQYGYTGIFVNKDPRLSKLFKMKYIMVRNLNIYIEKHVIEN
uniref:Ring finger domain protein n=1 Tax=Iridovirus LCIVAC01 TaxID=2506607 RepID=A0A481YSG5_9VIRU|nr:MAG: ring finger domain protein [Iridovirus LCIVAC01]